MEDYFIFEFYDPNPKFLKSIKKYGELSEDEKYPELRVPRNDVRKVYKKCKGHRFIYYEEKYQRSSDYRESFFKNNPPTDTKRGKPCWRCRYCNRKITKDKLEVDHVIPVYKAKREKKWRKKLPNGVNDPSNLVASCRMCNRRKGKKTGLWIHRAKWGNSKKYWLMINSIRAGLLLSVAALLAYTYFFIH